MELPRDILGEITKYAQPSLKNKLGITSKNNANPSPLDKVYSHNLSTLSGMDLLAYIWDNSLDDEFNNRDWTPMLNELPLFVDFEPNSIKLEFIDENNIYITDGQKNIIKNLVSNYYHLLYKFFRTNTLYILIGLYDIIPEDEILSDDYDNYLIGKLIHDDTDLDIVVEYLNDNKYYMTQYGLYNYGIANGEIFSHRDIQNIIKNMYYTPEKEELLRNLLDIVKDDVNVDIMLSLQEITHPVHDQKMKIICDVLIEKHYIDVIENYIDLYVDKFLEEGKTSTHKAKNFFCRIKDINMYKKIKKFFINIDWNESLKNITSPDVFQYILDTDKPSVEQLVKYFNPQFSVLIRDYIIKNNSVIETEIIYKFVPNYYIMRDLYKHYGIREYYNLNTELPEALQEYNGRDEELLKILSKYNIYPSEYSYAKKYLERHGYYITPQYSVRVDLSVKYFEKALELCSDHTKLFNEYCNIILTKEPRTNMSPDEHDFTLSYNFLKAYIRSYPNESIENIIKIILENKLHGLLELINFDEKMILDYIDEVMSKNEIAFEESEYIQYLYQILPVRETVED